MSVKHGPCPTCGETDCAWRNRSWQAQWMIHDPKGYYEWAWWTAGKEVRADQKDRERRNRRLLRRGR